MKKSGCSVQVSFLLECIGIRYAGKIREEAAIGRKLYRNPVREGRLGKLRLEEERTEIRYVKEDQE